MAKILVVDDSPTVGIVVQNALCADGHEIEMVRSFLDLPRCIVDQPDLVLLDLQMPSMSGMEVGRYVRRHERRPTKILIHSAQPAAELRQAADQLGAGVLRKGLPREEIRLRILAELDRPGGAG